MAAPRTVIRLGAGGGRGVLDFCSGKPECRAARCEVMLPWLSLRGRDGVITNAKLEGWHVILTVGHPGIRELACFQEIQLRSYGMARRLMSKLLKESSPGSV